MPTPKTSGERANEGPKTPATHVNMDAPYRAREHAEPHYETDAEGRTTRVMGADETFIGG
jgi:hypothetical protein